MPSRSLFEPTALAPLLVALALVAFPVAAAPSLEADRHLDSDEPGLAEADQPGSECTVDGLLADVREGMRTGSPALRQYLKKVLSEAALILPPEALIAEFEREQDPAVIEALGAALAERAQLDENPALVQQVLARAAGDVDPAKRAAALRSLRATASVEMMEQNGGEVSYQKLVLDDSSEVRQAVVDNLVAEDREVYSGHHAQLSETALETAFAAEDPKARAQLLGDISTAAVGPEAARSIAAALDDDDAGVRAASARALGGLPPSSAGDAKDALLKRFDDEEDLEVRRRIVESLVRLERTRAVPALHSFKRKDPRLTSEIDAWVYALSLGLQEWALIVREKERRLSP